MHVYMGCIGGLLAKHCTLYINLETNRHGTCKCVASPQLTTPSQHSGQLHGSYVLDHEMHSYDPAVQMMPCIALVHTY